MIRAVLYNFKKRRKAEESKESNESWRACALSEHVYVCQWTRNATVYKQPLPPFPRAAAAATLYRTALR